MKHDLQAHMDRLAAAAPPLKEWQRQRLAFLLSPISDQPEPLPPTIAGDVVDAV